MPETFTLVLKTGPTLFILGYILGGILVGLLNFITFKSTFNQRNAGQVILMLFLAIVFWPLALIPAICTIDINQE